MIETSREMSDELPTSDTNESPSQRRELRILIVEDVLMIHEVVERSLSDLNAVFISVRDGLTAMDEIEVSLPDLIILDLALPILDGWEVLRRLQSDDRTSGVAVVVMTAHGQSGLEQDVKRLGASAYIEKPFRPNDLRSAVYQALGLS
jgi:CheY-like chemotaxis protein